MLTVVTCGRVGLKLLIFLHVCLSLDTSLFPKSFFMNMPDFTIRDENECSAPKPGLRQAEFL